MKSDILADLTQKFYSICVKNNNCGPNYYNDLKQLTTIPFDQTTTKYGFLIYSKFQTDQKHILMMGFMTDEQLQPILKQGKLQQYYIACIFDKQKFHGKKKELVNILHSDPEWPKSKLIRNINQSQKERSSVTKLEHKPTLERIGYMKADSKRRIQNQTKRINEISQKTIFDKNKVKFMQEQIKQPLNDKVSPQNSINRSNSLQIKDKKQKQDFIKNKLFNYAPLRPSNDQVVKPKVKVASQKQTSRSQTTLAGYFGKKN